MTGRTTSFCTVTSPDKAKVFSFLPNHLFIMPEIKLCAESKNIPSPRLPNSYLVNNNTKLYEFSLLEAATKPNLSSFSAAWPGCVAVLRSDQSGAGQADQDP